MPFSTLLDAKWHLLAFFSHSPIVETTAIPKCNVFESPLCLRHTYISPKLLGDDSTFREAILTNFHGNKTESQRYNSKKEYWVTLMRYITLNKPYYYNNLVKDATLLSIAYPDVLKVETVGCTVSNRSILMFKLGHGKRGILLTGGVHGRESINSVAMMAMLEEYAYALSNPTEQALFGEKWRIDIGEFFEEFTLYAIPLLNPDGYMIALSGFNMIHNEEQFRAAKESGICYQDWKYNQCMVDINRDFPSKLWRPKFTGDTPGSQLETKALMKLMTELTTEAYIDYHSRGDEIYYYRSQMSEAYNERQYTYAKKLSLATGYQLVAPELEIDPGDTGGNTVHFYSEQTGMPAFTIETVPEEEHFPLSIQYQRTVYCQILYSPFMVVSI